MSMIRDNAAPTGHGGPIQLFYLKPGSARRPTVSHGEGVYLYDTQGRRYIDASSGPIASNIGHNNPRVIEASDRQMRQTAYASRAFFENEANVQLAEVVTRLAGPGFERAFFVSGGSEANESVLKLARQHAVASGQPKRWKVISRMPSYHGGTLGALALSGDPAAEALFGPMLRPMPKVSAPFTYRLPDGMTAQAVADACVRELEDTILREGPETVLGFILEPVGGLATGALVALDSYYKGVREVCDRYGLLLIYDEVMSGAGRTGTFLAAEHWPDARPDLVTLAKGLGAGYTPLGAVLASRELVDTVADAGGFMHGFTYAGNPLSCAIGHAVVSETIDKQLMQNAAAMGERLRKHLETIRDSSRIVGDVRGRGLLMAMELVEDKQSKKTYPAEARIIQRFTEIALERGLLLYSRRTANGVFGEWVMVAPPLVVNAEQVDTIAQMIADTVSTLESQL